MSIEELQRAIVIDPEFESLIPPLSADEFKQLEANIQRDGCTDPLTFSNGILVDGHNRYKICQKRGIAFKTETLKDCLSRDHVMVWIDERQLGRRNLDDDKRAMVALTSSRRRSNIARHEAAKTAANGGPARSPCLRKERIKLLWRATRCWSVCDRSGAHLKEAFHDQGICGSLGRSSVWLVVCTPRRQRGKQR